MTEVLVTLKLNSSQIITTDKPTPSFLVWIPFLSPKPQHQSTEEKVYFIHVLRLSMSVVHFLDLFEKNVFKWMA